MHAADPAALVRQHVRRRGRSVLLGGQAVDPGRLAVVAVGKAASTMLGAATDVLGDRASLLLAVDTSARVPLPDRARRLLAGHPTPDGRGHHAADEVESVARSLGRGDVLLFLLSGGASALLPAPVEGVTLDEKAATARLLMDAGAGISDLNTVRRHLSRLKGGGLARLAAPARVVTLALSDVVGDDPATIGSGPTVADPTTFAEARAVLVRHRLLARVPTSVRRHLDRGVRGQAAETVKPGDPLLLRARTLVLGGTAATAGAAVRQARALGLRAVHLGSSFTGEAREVAATLAEILRSCALRGQPWPLPVCLVGSGETTVTVRGTGRGGRNQEMAVAAAAVLARMPVAAVAAFLGTDGVDGPTDAAGGVVDDGTVARAQALGLPDPGQTLADNDAFRFLAGLGDLIVTGPTGTNAADVFVLLAAG